MISSSSREYLPLNTLVQGCIRSLSRRRSAACGAMPDRHENIAAPIGIDVRPWAQLIAILVLLGGGEARGVHRLQLRGVGDQGLARRAEIEQHRDAVVADVDVGRLDVEVQQLVGVDFAQAVHELDEHVADEVLLDFALALQDMLLQRAAALVLHDHVDGFVGAEEIDHAHHVGVRDPRQRAAFLEKTLESVAEQVQVLGRNGRHDLALAAQRQAGGQVFLDRHRRAVFVIGQVDDRKSARCQWAWIPGNFQESCSPAKRNSTVRPCVARTPGDSIIGHALVIVTKWSSILISGQRTAS